MKKTKPLPIPLNLVICGQTGRILTPANDNHPKYTGPHPADRETARRFGTKWYLTGEPCLHGHIAPRSTSDGKCVVCKWLQWQKVRRKKGKKPFRQNWARRKAEEAGERHFYGDPCPHGHDGLRWTHNGACVECTISASREYQLSEAGREYNKRWRGENIEKVRELNRNMKARRKGAEGFHTAQDIKTMLERQKFKCAECGESVCDKEERHIDHIMPLALGGTNWPHNLQILCPSCNLSKNAKHPLEWAKIKGRLV